MSTCIRFLQAQKAKTPEESQSPTSIQDEEDQKIPPHFSCIQREHVSPIGGDTIPPEYRVTTPSRVNGNGMGPTLAESVKERTDALQKVHSITNGHTSGFTPSRLETLSKKVIEKSDKKALKVPSHATSQLTEFLLHNPGILDPEKLDWDYEDEDKESQDGSYHPNIKRRRMATPPFSQEQYQPVPPMGIPTSPRKSNIRTPRIPLDTP